MISIEEVEAKVCNAIFDDGPEVLLGSSVAVIRRFRGLALEFDSKSKSTELPLRLGFLSWGCNCMRGKRSAKKNEETEIKKRASERDIDEIFN